MYPINLFLLDSLDREGRVLGQDPPLLLLVVVEGRAEGVDSTPGGGGGGGGGEGCIL